MQKHIADREHRLTESFNAFWSRLSARTTPDNADIYSSLSLADFIGMKNILSDINNIITLRLTIAAADFMRAQGIIDGDDHAEMLRQINNTAPNANGYDIEFVSSRTGKIIIAEVKANIPCGGRMHECPSGYAPGDSYGAAQTDGIITDVRHLVTGKSKSAISPADTQCLKFLVLLDCRTKAIAGLIAKARSRNLPLELYAPGTAHPDNENVYLIPLEIS